MVQASAFVSVIGAYLEFGAWNLDFFLTFTFLLFTFYLILGGVYFLSGSKRET